MINKMQILKCVMLCPVQSSLYIDEVKNEKIKEKCISS